MSIECIHVASAEQIWAERFDRKLTVEDLFDIQETIVRHVVAGVADVLGSIPQTMYRASCGKPVNELTAYEAVLAYHHYVRSIDRQAHAYSR